MNKEELKFLMSRGFTVSELLEIEGAGTPKQPEPQPAPEPEPKPEPKPAPEPAALQPDPVPAPASDPEPEKPDPSAAKIAALEAQIGQLQAQLLRLGTSQPGGNEEKIEDLVAAF